MQRTLSYTEVSTALNCFAQWDFAYGGRLAGTTLKSRQIYPILSDGRAWGAGVAAWHQIGDPVAAYYAITRALNDDVAEQARHGFQVDPERTVDQYQRLCSIFDHYVQTTTRLPGLSRLEGEINIPIPAHKRGSNRYRFHCYLDGHTHMGHPWIVEFKLRGQLTTRVTLERQPQYRWYALAYALETGQIGPVGVIVDERLNEAPHAPKINKNGVVSHDKRQFITPEDYLIACGQTGAKPSLEALESFKTRRWHQRVELIFTPDELREAAEELRSSAKLIRDLDSGALHPIRNGKNTTCRSCKFVGVCVEPHNNFLIDSIYERTEPKRLRGPRPEGVR